MRTSQDVSQYYNVDDEVFEDYAGIGSDSEYGILLTEGDAREYYTVISPLLNDETYTIKIFEQVGSAPYLLSDIFLTARDVPYSTDTNKEVTTETIYDAIVAINSVESTFETEMLSYVKAILSDLGRRKL